MSRPTPYVRINIYLDDPGLRTQLKIAAAHRGVSVSAYCLDAIRRHLGAEEFLSGHETEQTEHRAQAKAAAQKLDRLRSQVGPIGVPVRELIGDGEQS